MRILAPIGAIAASTNDLAPIGAMPVPTNEAQLRPLMGLQPQDVKTAWNNAVNAAGSGRVTAKLVQAAAQPFRSADSRQPIAKQRNRTLKLGSKHVDELIILLKSARSFINEAGEALRSRTSPGEIQWLHEQARRRLDQTLALVESKAKT